MNHLPYSIQEFSGFVHAIAWSPNRTRIAVLGDIKIEGCRETHFRFCLQTAGHPVFLNDQVLQVFKVPIGSHADILLEPGISEPSSPRTRITWR